jgi:MFS family permease
LNNGSFFAFSKYSQCSSYISDQYGRRFTFLLSSQGFIAGMLLQTFATNYTILLIGRALVGIGVGVGLAIDPIYISEMSPAKHRGELVTWSELGINVGILLGFCMSLFLVGIADEIQW